MRSASLTIPGVYIGGSLLLHVLVVALASLVVMSLQFHSDSDDVSRGCRHMKVLDVMMFENAPRVSLAPTPTLDDLLESAPAFSIHKPPSINEDEADAVEDAVLCTAKDPIPGWLSQYPFAFDPMSEFSEPKDMPGEIPLAPGSDSIGLAIVMGNGGGSQGRGTFRPYYRSSGGWGCGCVDDVPVSGEKWAKRPERLGQRSGGGRNLALIRHGGSKASEFAVKNALKWLAAHQEEDGHWDAKKYGAAEACDTQATALALLCFLGAGHSERNGEYSPNVNKAVAWLLRNIDSDGQLGKGEPDSTLGPAHCIAALALTEAGIMSGLSYTEDAAARAFVFTDRMLSGQLSDPHSLAWMAMQIRTVQWADLLGNSNAVEVVRGQIAACAAPSNPGDRAALHLARQLLFDAANVPAVNLRGLDDADVFSRLCATQSTFESVSTQWTEWNNGVKGNLVKTQHAGSDDKGSFDPVGASKHWGRVTQTALSCLTLEVYYRYLPTWKK